MQDENSERPAMGDLSGYVTGRNATIFLILAWTNNDCSMSIFREIRQPKTVCRRGRGAIFRRQLKTRLRKGSFWDLVELDRTTGIRTQSGRRYALSLSKVLRSQEWGGQERAVFCHS